MISAKLRHLRIAPRKVRLVADLIRGKSAEEAQTILNFTVKKAAQPILKLLNSALANVKNNFQLDPLNLYVSRITVDEGQKLKRWRSRARGTAYGIQKKTSHVNLALDEIAKSKRLKKVKKVAATELAATEGGEPRPKEFGREKPKLRPEAPAPKPKIEKGLRRIFRRKAF